MGSGFARSLSWFCVSFCVCIFISFSDSLCTFSSWLSPFSFSLGPFVSRDSLVEPPEASASSGVEVWFPGSPAASPFSSSRDSNGDFFLSPSTHLTLAQYQWPRRYARSELSDSAHTFLRRLQMSELMGGSSWAMAW